MELEVIIFNNPIYNNSNLQKNVYPYIKIANKKRPMKVL